MPEEIRRMMKAAVLHGWNDLRFEEVETPGYGPDEVLCRVDGCGICGTDLHMMKGNLKGTYPPGFPFILGHEWYGEIAALGRDVKGFSIGQRVTGEVQRGCGRCSRCMEGRYHLCMDAPRPDRGYRLYGHNVNGAYAEYVAVVQEVLHSMPDALGLEEGVSACNVGIGIEVTRRARVDLGDTVVVLGAGLLGLIVVQLAKISGAGRTVAVGRGHRLGVAGELGADILLDRTQGDPVARVKEITAGSGADVVIECAGTEEAVIQALGCVRRGGRVVLSGISEKKGIPLDTNRIVFDEIEVAGSRGAPNALPEALQLMSSGRINVKPLITHRFPLSEVQEAMDIFEKRRENVIRVALLP